MAKSRSIKPNDILDAALTLAADIGWAKVRMHNVADRLGVPLTALRRHVSDLDAVGNLLFVRAEQFMLAANTGHNFRQLSPKKRLFMTLTAWLNVLSPHRNSVRAMMAYKFKPAHVHHHVTLAVALSRTVQWWRDASHIDAIGRRQEVEEIGLSALLVATFFHWLCDCTPGQEGTRQTLRRRLNGADWLMAMLFRKMSW